MKDRRRRSAASGNGLRLFRWRATATVEGRIPLGSAAAPTAILPDLSSLHRMVPYRLSPHCRVDAWWVGRQNVADSKGYRRFLIHFPVAERGTAEQVAGVYRAQVRRPAPRLTRTHPKTPS